MTPCMRFFSSQGAFNEVEKNRIQGVMNFEKLKITDIDTTPRINVTAFPSDISYEEAYERKRSNIYPRCCINICNL